MLLTKQFFFFFILLQLASFPSCCKWLSNIEGIKNIQPYSDKIKKHYFIRTGYHPARGGENAADKAIRFSSLAYN